jgi:hypothetical protein
VIGEFVLCDYEVDDVVDAMHEGFLIKLDGVSSMLNDEKPAMRIVRFHGEGPVERSRSTFVPHRIASAKHGRNNAGFTVDFEKSGVNS